MKQLGYGSGFRFLAGSGFFFWAGSGFNVYGSETLLGGTAWRVPVPDDLDELPHGDMVGDEELGLVEHGQLLFTRKPLYDARDLNMSKGMPKMNNCGSVAVPVPYRYHFDRSGSFTVGAGEQLCGAGADLRSPFLTGSGKKTSDTCSISIDPTISSVHVSGTVRYRFLIFILTNFFTTFTFMREKKILHLPVKVNLMEIEDVMSK